jgi:excinuclease UvrABC nuclease subunit
MNALDWTVTTLASAALARVPARPGLYMIAAATRAAGVPLSVDPIYVGRSKNLQRRLGEHANPWREHNRQVGAALLQKELEFWYSEVPEEQLNQLEVQLINVINPHANRVRYQIRRTK